MKEIINFFIKSYLSYKLQSVSKNEKDITLIFSRGAFKKDIDIIYQKDSIVSINCEFLRRLTKLVVPDAYLSQVTALEYSDYLKKEFNSVRESFKKLTKGKVKEIVFGGVDYFEVAIFADKKLYDQSTEIIAIFHENYAIDYVKNINMKIYSQIEKKIIFDKLYTYGSPATEILKHYTNSSGGPIKKVMPRLMKPVEDRYYRNNLAKINTSDFYKTVTIIAFPGVEYLAPICFTSTVIYATQDLATANIKVIIKFKNKTSAKPTLRQFKSLEKHVNCVYKGSIEEQIWKSGFVIVYNSIAFYEALLGPSIIIIPSFYDAQHDENLLQESSDTLSNLKSVVFARSKNDITETIKKFTSEKIIELVSRERENRIKAIAKKFYI